jgi:hypothetical protein
MEREDIYSSISQDLARMNEAWKASLVKILKGLPRSPRRLTLKMQFETLLLQPAKDMDSIGPILIIIDALDESGSPEQRVSLLQTLVRLSQLPTHFRFLITSRPELDIVYAFRDKPWVHSKSLDLADKSSTDNDIMHFVKNRLHQLPPLKAQWKDEWAVQIAARSDHLFQWAFTACQYVSSTIAIGFDPVMRLNELLSSGSYNGLDGLYRTILDQVSNFKPGDETSRLFEIIIGRVLSVREPISMEALSGLWYDEEDKDQVYNILSPLGSLLWGVSGRSEPVQPLHASLIDFLTDKVRAGPYYVDLADQNERLSCALLREMQRLLKFNICKLETSYKLNRDVQDLDSRVHQCIPPHLTYACCFWVDHIQTIKPTRTWYDHVCIFMKRYFFFWLEALSLADRIERAIIQLTMLRDWLEHMVSKQNIQIFVVIMTKIYG